MSGLWNWITGNSVNGAGNDKHDQPSTPKAPKAPTPADLSALSSHANDQSPKHLEVLNKS